MENSDNKYSFDPQILMSLIGNSVSVPVVQTIA